MVPIISWVERLKINAQPETKMDAFTGWQKSPSSRGVKKVKVRRKKANKVKTNVLTEQLMAGTSRESVAQGGADKVLQPKTLAFVRLMNFLSCCATISCAKLCGHKCAI